MSRLVRNAFSPFNATSGIPGSHPLDHGAGDRSPEWDHTGPHSILFYLEGKRDLISMLLSDHTSRQLRISTISSMATAMIVLETVSSSKVTIKLSALVIAEQSVPRNFLSWSSRIWTLR
jgi:hypothetical protein